MTNTPDTRPTVSPIEGFYAMLRNGECVGPIKQYDTNKNYPYLFTAHLPHMSWTAEGVSDWDDSDFDIIATISPEAMALAADPQKTKPVVTLDADMAFGMIDRHTLA